MPRAWAPSLLYRVSQSIEIMTPLGVVDPPLRSTNVPGDGLDSVRAPMYIQPMYSPLYQMGLAGHWPIGNSAVLASRNFLALLEGFKVHSRDSFEPWRGGAWAGQRAGRVPIRPCDVASNLIRATGFISRRRPPSPKGFGSTNLCVNSLPLRSTILRPR